ncbi:cation:dicarboxylate symporter family transporter, partial [Klebsiella pneumoniae]
GPADHSRRVRRTVSANLFLNQVRKVGNIPVAGILLLMGIDHFLDMGRSAINVLGNGIATAMLSKNEGLLTDEEAQPDWEVEKAEA